MTLEEGLLLFISILLFYAIGVFILKKKGIFEKYNISLYGPALLFRTKRGINFLKKIASKKRFWKSYGNFGVVFILIIMIFFVIFFLWQFNLLIGLSPEQRQMLPGPEFMLVLPGINPILPLEFIIYILIGLIVAILVHEFSHGILTLASDLKVKSMGVMYMIIPIGAFVEPDEEQMKETKITKRMRVYAVGPLANLVTFFICFLLFAFVFMGSAQPVSDGVVIVTLSDDAPADNYGFQQGMIISSINNTSINDYYDFFVVMNDSEAGSEVEIQYYWHGLKTKQVVLSDKYEEYAKRWPSMNNASYKGKGYLGIGPTSHDVYLSVLKDPFGYNIQDRFMYFIGLPIFGYFEGYNPIVYPFTESYEITGPLGILPNSIFWAIVNIIYWIAWLNLMVGLFNVLPMIPLDGGFLFNDYIRLTVLKIKKGISKDNLEKIVKNVSLVVSLFILFLILFQFFVKYI